jgi:hypothetical protein
MMHGIELLKNPFAYLPTPPPVEIYQGPPRNRRERRALRKSRA